MNEARAARANKTTLAKSAAGFTLIQLLIVVAVVTVVGSLAAFEIRASRASLRLNNSARLFASYLEKARVDSVRRRVQPGAEASVQVLNSTSYRVTMGFNGSNALSSRDFNLEDGVIFDTDPTTVSFDWRGRPITGQELHLP